MSVPHGCLLLESLFPLSLFLSFNLLLLLLCSYLLLKLGPCSNLATQEPSIDLFLKTNNGGHYFE